MKRISSLIILFILVSFISACAGYKPLYTTKLQFEIADYSIKSDKKLGKQIYSKLFSLSKSTKKNENTKSINIIIDVSKNKNATAKDDAGKILEYKIILNSKIIAKDYLTSSELLNQNFNYFSSYKVQDQNSETIKLENKTIENLIDKTFQNILIQLSQNLLKEW